MRVVPGLGRAVVDAPSVSQRLLIVNSPSRLPPLTTVWVPEGVDEAAIRQRLLSDYNVEIAGGLGAYKGRAWRIGLMGYSSRRENVLLLLAALRTLLG